MDAKEKELRKIVKVMLAENNCRAESSTVIKKLIAMLKEKLREIAETTNASATLASRTRPCYYDVERTFRLLSIRACDLRVELNKKYKGGTGSQAINLSPGKTQTQLQMEIVVHAGDKQETCNMTTMTPMGSGAMSMKTPEPPGGYLQPTPQMEMSGFGLRRRYKGHIPKFLEPFPPAHTYKKTPINSGRVISLEERQKHCARVKLEFQQKLVEMSKRKHRMISVLGVPTNDSTFLLPAPQSYNNRPAYLTALLPHKGMGMRMNNGNAAYHFIDNEKYEFVVDEKEHVELGEDVIIKVEPEEEEVQFAENEEKSEDLLVENEVRNEVAIQ